jgi:hypothetical protein
MCRACLLLAVVVPIVFTAAHPRDAVRKDVLVLTVRADSGAATRFELKATDFAVFPRREWNGPQAAPATITIAGMGSVELISADSGRQLVADTRLTTMNGVFTGRYSGRELRIKRASLVSDFSITTP